jgi:hypothetical protein
LYPALLLFLGAGILGGAFYARKGSAAEMTPATKPTLDELYAKYGAQYGVDPLLIKSIAIVESAENPAATRIQPPRDISVGLMQILCVPNDEGVCTNKLNVSPWPVTFNALLDPEMNLRIAVQILKWNLDNYGYPRGIAIYNNWSARHASVDGPFPNDAYVARVLHHYNQLKGTSS